VPDNISSDFFREKKNVQQPVTNKRLKYFFIIFVTVLYAFAAIALGVYIQMNSMGIMTGLTLYLYGLIGGVATLLLKKLFAESEQSRQLLLEVLEGGQGARLITDLNYKSIYHNVRFRDLVLRYGQPNIENFCKLFEHPLKIKRQMEKLAQNISKTKNDTLNLATEINNKPHYFKLSVQEIKNWPDHLNWRIDDITDHHQMEKAIHDEREKLIDFTDNAPVGFFSIDENGTFQFVNSTFANWLGSSIKDLVHNASLHDFLAEKPQNLELYKCFNNDQEHQQGELLFKGSDNRVFPVSLNHLIVKDEEGKIRTRSVVYDLTTEQEAAKALRKSENRFERLFAEAPVGICLLSKDGKLSECNAAFIKMIGQPEKMIVHRSLKEFVIPDNHDQLADWTRRIFKGEKAYNSIELTIKTVESETITQVYAQKFDGQNHTVLHFIDLTELKNLEQQFTQSQKMQAIGQLAGGIAHDFNNLLTAMIGFCDLLLLRHKPGDASFGDLMQIKQNANRAANLVRQLLAFSRQQTLQPRTLDLTDVLTELSHLVRRLIGANIDLSIGHETDIGLVKVDQGQLEQVLINLAVNARDAMKEGGRLSIKTYNFSNESDIKLKGEDPLPAGDWVAFAVEDTGTGIDPQNLSRIFEPFFSTKEVGAGTGLGLSTVHGIVHQTGGAISVDSVLGSGTTFTVYLPRHYEDEQEQNIQTVIEEEVAPDLTGSAKILLVEDEDAVRTFSSRALGNKGYDVLEAATGEQALELIKAQKPDLELVITDVVMPEMDGPTMAKELVKLYPNVKIIFISGYAEDRFKDDLGEDVWFLPKPFTLKQLATKVKEVIDV